MNLRMPDEFRIAYRRELAAYRRELDGRNFPVAWHCLERAHLVGQYHPVPHTAVHFRMLLFALRMGDLKEFVGQALRLSVGWFGSLLNRIPVGNTGGADVPIMQPMPIPEDLRDLLGRADTSARGLSGLRPTNDSVDGAGGQ